MALVIPPGYGQAAMIHTSAEGTAPFVCTLGVDISGYGGDWVQAANDAFSCWAGEIMPIMDSNLTLSRVSLAIGADGPSGSVDSTAAAVNGGRSIEGLPWSCSAIANKQTAEIGRRGRGRMYIPGVVAPSEIGQSGAISNTRRTAIVSALNDYYSALVIGVGAPPRPLPPVLLHASGSSVPTEITSFGLAPLVGWIRKRIR